MTEHNPDNSSPREANDPSRGEQGAANDDAAQRASYHLTAAGALRRGLLAHTRSPYTTPFTHPPGEPWAGVWGTASGGQRAQPFNNHLPEPPPSPPWLSELTHALLTTAGIAGAAPVPTRGTFANSRARRRRHDNPHAPNEDRQPQQTTVPGVP